MNEEFVFIPPQKASLSSTEFLERVDNDKTWACGEKMDGYREQVHFGSTRNEMFSSGGNSHIDRCPQFKVLVPELVGTVIDCEGLSPTRMLEDNAACFKSDPVNSVAWQDNHGMATLVTFDLLKYKGTETMHLTFKERRHLLELTYAELVRHCYWNTQLRLEILVMQNKLKYWEKIVARPASEGHEGVILKRMGAPYMPASRGDAWLKVKREEVLVCIITGFIEGTGQFKGQVGALSFQALNDAGEIVATSYTSGMSNEERKDMTLLFDTKYRGKRCYVGCQEVTRAGSLRHPRFLGMYEEQSK